MDKTIIYTIAGIALVVVLIAFAFYSALSGSAFTETPVRDWTQAEAIFYGCCVIALGLFFGGK